MQKRAEKKSSRYVKSAAFSEMFILILASVAFAFMIGQISSVVAIDEQLVPIQNTPGSHPESVISSIKPISVPGAPALTPTPTGFTPLTPIGNPAIVTLSSSGQEINLATDAISQSADGTLHVVTASGNSFDVVGAEGSQAVSELAAQGYAFGHYGVYSGIFGSQAAGTTGAIFNSLGTGLIWAAVAFGIGQMIGSVAGLQKGQTNALSFGLAAGAFAYQVSQGTAFAQLFVANPLSAWQVGLSGGIIGLAVGAVVFAALYKEQGHKTISLSCIPYQPVTGGAKCEQCNKDPLRPCTEYRCKSLGQACELLNKDTPGKESCAWVNPKDVNSPTITPWTGALYPNGLSYISDTSVRPPALGVKIVKNGGECLPAFTPLKFGITTNEPAQCKVDYNHTKKFEDMQFYLGESPYYEYNHTQIMRLPGPNAFNLSSDNGGSPIFQNDGTSQLFVRCRDANGNENVDEYSVKFCVDKSPDTTPPLIEGNSVNSGSPVRFGTNNISVETYVNEPAECKWSINDKAYEDMENTMSCNNDIPQIRNGVITTVCVANLFGLKSTSDNTFYMRCKDQPGKVDSERNVMVQSYQYVLKGSQQLNIVNAGPNGTVSGSTDKVSVDLTLETSNGAEEGKSICLFSPTGQNNSYISMFETNSFQHKQTLQLVNGVYTYYFRCTDLGGNTAESKVTFSVFADRDAPKVTSVYKEEGTGLKIVTNENAECAYSLTGCNFVFDEGLKALYANPSIQTSSYVEWKPNTVYYIKCRDKYGNEPNPNECSVIVKPIENSVSK